MLIPNAKDTKSKSGLELKKTGNTKACLKTTFSTSSGIITVLKSLMKLLLTKTSKD